MRAYLRMHASLRVSILGFCRNSWWGFVRPAVGFGETVAFARASVRIGNTPTVSSREPPRRQKRTYRYRPRSFVRRQKRANVVICAKRCEHSYDQ